MPPPRKFNANTIIGSLSLGVVVTLLTLFWQAHKYLSPIERVPAAVERIESKIESMDKTQIIQTEALKILADVASDTDTLRRDVDRHTHEIDTVKKRLDKIE